MGRFLFLQNTVGIPAGVASPPGDHTIKVIDQYDLDRSDLSNLDGLLLSQHLDEHHLVDSAAILSTFLGEGGAISLNGPVYEPYLDGLGAYEPLADAKAEDWLLRLDESHPITHGVLADDLTYRRGVVGFWARGGFPQPPGATVLTRMIGQDTPADVVWHREDGGVVVIHPGNDVWFVHGDDTSAGRFYANMLDWMTERRRA